MFLLCLKSRSRQQNLRTVTCKSTLVLGRSVSHQQVSQSCACQLVLCMPASHGQVGQSWAGQSVMRRSPSHVHVSQSWVGWPVMCRSASHAQVGQLWAGQPVMCWSANHEQVSQVKEYCLRLSTIRIVRTYVRTMRAVLFENNLFSRNFDHFHYHFREIFE